MFAILNSNFKKDRFLKIKIEPMLFYNTEIYFLTAPVPKTKIQLKKLNNFLIPFEKRIVFSTDFKNVNLTTQQYPTYTFKNLCLLNSFLTFCKNQYPKFTAIYFDLGIKPEFFYELSKYTEVMYIISKNKDYSLCDHILKLSGTPVVFSDFPPENAITLSVNPNITHHITFSHAIFSHTIFSPLPLTSKNFSKLDTVLLCSALYNECNQNFALEHITSQLINCINKKYATT